jgi:AraC-like DNA-binding protein
VIDTIEADYAHPLRIEHLARVAGWSTAHLHEMFRNHVGVSPHQLLLQRRLRAAKELLLAKTESVKEIANACGFGNSPAFVRVFKKHTGRTPAVFRQHYLSA